MVQIASIIAQNFFGRMRAQQLVRKQYRDDGADDSSTRVEEAIQAKLGRGIIVDKALCLSVVNFLYSICIMYLIW